MGLGPAVLGEHMVLGQVCPGGQLVLGLRVRGGQFKGGTSHPMTTGQQYIATQTATVSYHDTCVSGCHFCNSLIRRRHRLH